jgi:hypothetical protein
MIPTSNDLPPERAKELSGSSQGAPRRENASTSSGPETDGPFQGA